MRRIAVFVLVCIGATALVHPVAAQEDCPTAMVLTDMSPVTIPGGTWSNGNIVEPVGACITSNGETRSRWFVFTVVQGGTFNFTVTPTVPTDFDWTLYNISSTYPAGVCNIFSSVELSCNFSGSTAETGIGCANGNACNPTVTLQTCNSYALLVNRWTTSSTSGFTLTMSGTAVLGQPGGNFNISFTNTPVCLGQPVTFTPSVASTAYNYLWDFGGGATSNQQSPTHTFTTPGNYPISLTLTAVNPTGCGDDATVTQTVLAAAPPGIQVSPATSNTCPGQAVSLSAQSGATGATFAWSPATGLSVATGNTVSASPSTTTTYTVTVTNASGCTAQATAVVNVNTSFTISGSPLQSSVCPGGSTTLTASGGTSYTWAPGAGLSAVVGASVTATPSSTTTYTVTGTDAAGCSDTEELVVTVHTLPLLSINPTNPIVCAGLSETLTASGAATYSWAPNTGLNTVNGASVIASPVVNTTYTVTGTDANGCTATQTVSVTVVGAASVSIDPVSSVLCNGDDVVLNASGATSYAWSPTAGLSVATGSTVTASPATTTTYTVVGTVSAGCTASATAVVTVSVSTSVVVNPAAPSVCTGNSVSLTASGASTYAWTPATGLSVANAATTNATPGTATTYTVIGTSAAGCTGSTTVAIAVHTPVQVGISASDSTLCPGTGTVLSGSNVSQYQWQPGNGSGASFNVNPTASTTYTLTGTDANGCTTQASLTISVLAVTPISAVNGSGLVCAGDSATLQASGAAAYTWAPPTGLGATSGAAVTASPAISTTYTVSSLDANGCTATATVVVNIDPLPDAQFTVTPQNGCEPLNVQFHNTSTNAVSVQWFFGDGTASSLPAPTHTFGMGSYQPWMIVANAAGCYDTASLQSPITVYGPPTALFTVSPDTGVLMPYVEAVFSFVNLSSGAATYHWTFGDGNTSTQINPVHQYQTEGTYTVTLIATTAEGCSDVYSLSPLLVDGVPPLFIPNLFSPNNDGINDIFSIYGVAISTIRLRIFDRWGTMVFETRDRQEGWDGTFNGQKANPGVYIYQADILLLDGKQLLKYGDITLVR